MAAKHDPCGSTDRWEICQETFDALRERVDDLEKANEKVWDLLQKIAVDTAGIKGRIAGYLLAGTVLASAVGAAVGMLVQTHLKP